VRFDPGAFLLKKAPLCHKSTEVLLFRCFWGCFMCRKAPIKALVRAKKHHNTDKSTEKSTDLP
jgi:hypothetical protein